MVLRIPALICLFSILSICSSKPNILPRVPEFSDNYVVKGILLLPYAEIKEPFVAYYDKANDRSRIDYYGDMVKTYQRVDLNTSYKIAYMPDQKGVPQRTCFQVNGSEATPVQIQSILPDLSTFTYARDEPCTSYNSDVPNLDCEVWTTNNTVGNKENGYTMYLKKGSQEPVHYIMKGYNSLLGSHYDKYELYYTSFNAGNVTESDFDVEAGLECQNFPGPGVEMMASNNPMIEYVNNDYRHVDSAFDEFKKTHKKTYNDDKDHDWRQSIFLQNYRYVSSMNRAGLTFALELNHLADFTDGEMRKLRGRLPSKGYNGGKPFPEIPDDIPESIDWQLYGAVTPVKDQAVCGSCWSFGTTGTIEGTHFLTHKKLVRLSQQQLIDCSWKFQNNGCDGGEDFRAYQYIMDAGGLASEEDYGSYLGADGICHDMNVTKTAKITGYVNVTSGDINALKKAIAYKGPISVSIDAAHKSLSFYSYGVYYEPECKHGVDELDHSVLAVGYGSVNGNDYWIIKNSWSTYWGNDGYVLMSQKDNMCGVVTSPTYVLM